MASGGKASARAAADGRTDKEGPSRIVSVLIRGLELYGYRYFAGGLAQQAPELGHKACPEVDFLSQVGQPRSRCHWPSSELRLLGA